jgi:hypothetical protein
MQIAIKRRSVAEKRSLSKVDRFEPTDPLDKIASYHGYERRRSS